LLVAKLHREHMEWSKHTHGQWDWRTTRRSTKQLGWDMVRPARHNGATPQLPEPKYSPMYRDGRRPRLGVIASARPGGKPGLYGARCGRSGGQSCSMAASRCIIGRRTTGSADRARAKKGRAKARPVAQVGRQAAKGLSLLSGAQRTSAVLPETFLANLVGRRFPQRVGLQS